MPPHFNQTPFSPSRPPPKKKKPWRCHDNPQRNGCRSRHPAAFQFFKFDCQFWDFFPDVNLCVHTSFHLCSCCFSFSFQVIDKYRLISRLPPSHSSSLPHHRETSIDYFDFLFDLSRTRSSSLDENCQIRTTSCAELIGFSSSISGVETVRTLNSTPHKFFHNNTPYTRDRRGLLSFTVDSSFIFFFSFDWFEPTPTEWNEIEVITQIQKLLSCSL